MPDQVGHDVFVITGLTGNLLLIKCSSNVNSASNCTTNHRVVTDAEESHHLNVSWNRRRTCELCVRVHTTHCVSHKSNGYRPNEVRPCVSHWTSIPYEAISNQIRGVFLPKSRHMVILSSFGSAFSSTTYLDVGLFSVQWAVCMLGHEKSLAFARLCTIDLNDMFDVMIDVRSSTALLE